MVADDLGIGRIGKIHDGHPATAEDISHIAITDEIDSFERKGRSPYNRGEKGIVGIDDMQNLVARGEEHTTAEWN